MHQLRWNELLRHIVIEARDALAPSASILNVKSYDEKSAPKSFLKDLAKIRKKSSFDFLALLFDEIERISFGTASSRHWNDERDFLLFWQSIRAGFQDDASPFTFLIVGTNPSCIERVSIFESDNPLFGNVEKRFIPMFSQNQIEEMVDQLGSIMGLEFDGECKVKLLQDFGGHPFLTRYACSYIAKESPKRPIVIDRTAYSVGVREFATEADSYVEAVVGLLQKEYADEHEMLRYLGQGDDVSFQALADGDPRLLEHILGYGLVSRGEKAFYFRIGVVQKYFSQREKPASLLSQADRLAEISKRRNELEQKLRERIRTVVCISFHKNERRQRIAGKLSKSRQEALSAISFEDLLSPGSSPLYFDELKSIILGYWEKFENLMGVEKNEFDYHMNTVNRLRNDAHAKDIDEKEFSKIRVSIDVLEEIVAQ